MPFRAGYWLVASSLMAASASAQEYRVGQEIEADGTQLGTQWKRCVVVDRAPGGDSYQIRCLLDAKSTDYGGETWTNAKWMRPRRVPGTAPIAPDDAPTPSRPLAPGMATISQYRVGQTVLASPSQIQAGWTRCVVLERATGTDSYRVRCAIATGDPYGRPIVNISEAWTNPRWMKPDAPSFRPGLTVAAGMAQDAARNRPRPAPRQPVDGAARAVAGGVYLCWANGRARQNLNFRVSGGGYSAADGSGAIRMGPGGRVSFTGPLAAATGAYTAVYREPGGRPTVSFRDGHGDEVAFCEQS